VVKKMSWTKTAYNHEVDRKGKEGKQNFLYINFCLKFWWKEAKNSGVETRLIKYCIYFK
jgi:hypothetical protein